MVDFFWLLKVEVLFLFCEILQTTLEKLTCLGGHESGEWTCSEVHNLIIIDVPVFLPFILIILIHRPETFTCFSQRKIFVPTYFLTGEFLQRQFKFLNFGFFRRTFFVSFVEGGHDPVHVRTYCFTHFTFFLVELIHVRARTAHEGGRFRFFLVFLLFLLRYYLNLDKIVEHFPLCFGV